jgi:predicted transcriptional regulator
MKKTHILYLVKLNHYQLTRYLGLLLRLEMVEEISAPFTGYRITDKGRILLKLFATD